jgi:hypothetical protein
MLLKRKKKEKRVGACAHESYGRLLLSYVIIYSSKGPMTIQFGTYLIFVSKQNVSNDSNKFEKKKKVLFGLRVQVDRKSSERRFRALAELFDLDFFWGVFFVLLFFEAGRASGRVQRRRRSCKSGSVYF